MRHAMHRRCPLASLIGCNIARSRLLLSRPTSRHSTLALRQLSSSSSFNSSPQQSHLSLAPPSSETSTSTTTSSSSSDLELLARTLRSSAAAVEKKESTSSSPSELNSSPIFPQPSGMSSFSRSGHEATLDQSIEDESIVSVEMIDDELVQDKSALQRLQRRSAAAAAEKRAHGQVTEHAAATEASNVGEKSPSPPSSSPPTPRSRAHLSDTARTTVTVTPERPLVPVTSSTTRFRLTSKFLEGFKSQRPPFGFNGLGELVYLRTYSRKITTASGVESNESWWQTVERVVNGTYNLQKRWIEEHALGWNAKKAQRSAQEMYKRIFEMKFLPPGRGLWAMGSQLTEERKLYAALNNCAFVSTADMRDEPSKPFTFLMDASMLGVGVGFDTKGAGTIMVKRPLHKGETLQIADSREGWVDALRLTLDAYFLGRALPEFDTSLIRPFGTPIRGFGGLASGPQALVELLVSVRQCLDARIGSPLSVTDIVDIMNFIGRCVVAGNVRRTAEIAFGAPESAEYLDLKNYTVNPHRAAFGWTSNNSIFAELGMDYAPACERIRANGEPGFAWLDNMRSFGRMNGTPDERDHRAAGGNPCLEQTLESFEMCCLVETFPHRHADLDDFKRTLKFAYLYAKTVTLGKTHWPETNRVMLRNRRIGCSVSGIAQFISARSLADLKLWLEQGYETIQSYDRLYSDWLAIPRSIKTTSVKPSGTVSLLAGATPGVHHPESRFYLRRVRLAVNSPLVPPLQAAGYHIEPVADGDPSTCVVSIPIDAGANVRVSRQVSMWEQLALAAFMQRHWADNQVSCTITFDPETEGHHLAHALDFYQYQLKGISFLPRLKLGAYKQMPYEEISEDEYTRQVAVLKPLSFVQTRITEADTTPDRWCDGDSCSTSDFSGQVAGRALEEENEEGIA